MSCPSAHVSPPCFEHASYTEMLLTKSPKPTAWFCLAKFTEPVSQEENEVSQYRSILEDSGLACCTLPIHIAGGHASPVARLAAGEKGCMLSGEATSRAYVDHCKILVLDHKMTLMTLLRVYRSIEKYVRLERNKDMGA